MRTERREERHRHVALVAATSPRVSEFDRVDVEFNPPQITGFSLLRLSLPARLLMVGAAAALLWGAVFWALA
jgi:hypothetical protein